MRDLRSMTRAVTAVAAAMIAASGVATPTAARAQQAQPAAPAKHHSKLKGALVGGAAGAAVGHPKLGAAAGVMHQHNKNKKAKAAG